MLGKKVFLGGTALGMLLVVAFGLVIAWGAFFFWSGSIPLGQVYTSLQGLRLPLPIFAPSEGQDRDSEASRRVTVLLLGLDQRPQEKDIPSRSDTIILATVDPANKTAGMLSIPRDLWATIPLHGQAFQDRINTAYVYGEINRYPGGGPALARDTVTSTLGVNIQHYVVIDFQGLEKVIDALGGITIDVPKPLVDDRFPTYDYGYQRVTFAAGVQQMNGQTAVRYARVRNPDSDFERMKRQQQVLMAMRDKALRIDVIPKLPQLFKELAGTVKTDLVLADIVRLAKIGKDIEIGNITALTLEGDAVTPYVTPGGADVLLLRREKAQELVSQLFLDPRLRAEDASVEVLNGTNQKGLAARTANYLMGKGLKHVTYGDAPDSQNHSNTVILDYNGKSQTARYLARLFNIPTERIKAQTDSHSVDIQLILGEDAKSYPE
ncbi:MAG: LCP family protein [Chloroflexi bacterium]|nr:LCP family protein [Chloroflexota bacterium]